MLLLNNTPVNITIFPDKTSQVWKLTEGLVKEYNIIRWEWRFEDNSEGELFHVLQLCTLIRVVKPGSYIVLDCPYLPWARQHKEISNETTFALHIFCDIIEYYINELVTFDVHNVDFFYKETTKAGYANQSTATRKSRWEFKLTNFLPEKEIKRCVDAEGIYFVVFPDESAQKRYSSLISTPYIFIEKERDQMTGNIIGMKMPDIPEGKNILVVDDLADGGFTFIQCAGLINKYNPNKLILYVSHALFSKGTRVIHEAGYSKIYDKNGVYSIFQATY